MRRPWTLALALLLAAGPLAHAQTEPVQKQVQKKLDQQRKDEKAKASELDALLDQALKNNPDIRVAESKLREAEAEVYRARMSVFGKIMAARQDVASHKAVVEQAEARLVRERELLVRNAISQADVQASMAQVQKARADLARVEAEVDALVGKNAEKFRASHLAFSPDGKIIAGADGSLVRVWDAVTGREATGVDFLLRAINERVANVQPSTADKLRTFLDTPFKGTFEDVTLKDLLEMIQKKHPGVNIHLGGGVPHDAAVTVRLGEPVPLGAVFQLLEDRLGMRFVVREYGIVAIDPDHVPPGALYVHDFWKKSREKAPSN